MSRFIDGWFGEFGLKLRYWVPQVHTACLREHCIVEIEPGEEALYPAAESWQIATRPPDSSRHGSPPDLGLPESRFVPEPYVEQGVGEYDVVVCPRWRSYGSQKNWPLWPRLVIKLRRAGVSVGAAGAPDSSLAVPCEQAWEYQRFLDASIEMIKGAGVVIATDAGLAHLAVMCGTPLVLVTYRGRVAPGPVIDSNGAVVYEQYWPVRREEYYDTVNHCDARIDLVDGWENVTAVIDAAIG